MKRVRCLLGFYVLCACSAVLVDCIRVPTEWPKPYKNNRSKPYRDINTSTRLYPPGFSGESVSAPRYPHTKYTITPKRTYHHHQQQPYQYNAVLKDNSNNGGGWIPIPPNRNAIVVKKVQQYGKYPPKEYNRNDNAYKRYKPKKASSYTVHGSSVSVSSEHEVPANIPTRPVYPGEGQWAQRGQKYRPYVRQENPYQPQPQQNREQYEKRPDGYDTFLDQKLNFNYAREQYDKNFGSTSGKSSPYAKKYTDTVPYGTHESYEEDPQGDEFIPTKLYTQVRRTEKEVHMPKGVSDDPRLREVIKDSKIQTVYTEEGYEDGAYDHAGHIKEAESEEGRLHFNNDQLRNKGAKYGSYSNGEGAEESRYREVEERDKNGNGADKDKKKPWRKAQMVKDTKKSTVKNLENGASDMEVFSEVKVMTTPTKGNETHKFVKITPTNKSVRMKIPLVHKFAVKEEPNALGDSSKSRTRRRRSTDPTGLDKKFPYYKLDDVEVLDKNSPLRYSENLANVPRKTSGDMSFYNSRPDFECPDVDDTADPIPERIKNAKDDGVEEGPNEGAVQRLKGLGDKIDCFKAKYFGENPLDNPLFKEETIQLVLPDIFARDLKIKAPVVRNTAENEAAAKTSAKKVAEERDNVIPKVKIVKASNVDNDSEEYDDEYADYYENTPKQGDLETTTLPAVENATQGKKIPKNIYDQIDAANVAERAKVHVVAKETEDPDDVNEVSLRTAKELVQDNEKLADDELLKTANAETQTVSVAADDEEEEESDEEEFSAGAHEGENSSNDTESAAALPYRAPYSIRRQSSANSNYIRPPMKPGRHRPKKKPRRKLQHQRSEVQYKDDIKPSEQLHVLSDILRNIQNSTGELIQTPLPTSSINRSSYKPRNKHRRRRIKIVPPPPTLQDAEATLNTDLNLGEVENEQFTYIRPPLVKSATTANYEAALLDSFGSETIHFDEIKPKKTYPTVYPTGIYKNHKESTEIFDGFLTSETLKPEEAVDPLLGLDTVIDGNEIIGLVPPSSKTDYRTIVPIPAPYYPSVPTGISAGISIGSPHPHHNYYVPNMKPPEKNSFYAFDGNNLKRAGHVYYRRARRSPLEYKEIRQSSRKPFRFRDDVTEEPIEVKYDKFDEGRTREASLDDYDEDEEIPSTVVVTTPRTTTTEGPLTKSFLEFVAELKTEKNYVLIPDPTTTEKGATTIESETNKSTVSTTTGTPPAFLSFVSQLKESDSYVYIPEKKKVATTTAKTTENDEDDDAAIRKKDAEDDEEEEENRGPVQNSRLPSSFSDTETSGTLTPEGEYLPKARSYAISAIDTSKYKTIDRNAGSTAAADVTTAATSMRHGLSSRYNSDKDSIASGEMNTVRVPILSRGDGSGRSAGSSSESDELELDGQKANKPTAAAKSSTELSPVAVPTPVPTASPAVTSAPEAEETKPTAPRNTKRRMWVRTQKRTSSTSAPDVAPSASSSTTVASKRRRGRTRIRLTSTTESTASELKKKRSIKSASDAYPEVPPNHKPEYTPIIPRLSYKQLNHVYSPNKITPAMREHLENEEYFPETDAETFREPESKARHGGNYRSLENTSEGTTEISRYTDVVPKPFTYYTDPALPARVNQLNDGHMPRGFQEEPDVDADDLDADSLREANEKEKSFVITVPDLDNVSNVNVMKSRRFQRPEAAERRSNSDEEDDITATESVNERTPQYSIVERRKSLVPYFVKDPSKRLYYYAIE